jgi:hypothetical protein
MYLHLSVKLRIKPGHIPLIGGYGEIALRVSGGSLGSAAKNFLFAYKKSERREQRPRYGISHSTKKATMENAYGTKL